MNIPEVHSFADMFARCERQLAGERRRAALVWPLEEAIVAAVIEATDKGLLDAVIIGDRQRTRALLKQHGSNTEGMVIIESETPRQAMDTTIQQAQAKEIDLVIQGQVSMEEMAAILSSLESGFCQPGKILSHVAVMKPEKYPKLLTLTDSAILPAPDLSQKIGLISNLVSVSLALGIDNPRIAIVAAVEAIYPHMPVTLDAAVLAKMAERGQIKGAVVDGPLSYDVAVDMEAALAKGIGHSPVAGQADGMVASSVEVANGIYLAMSLYGRCDIGGVIAGGLVPVAASFPSDSPSSRFNSILLALLLS